MGGSATSAPSSIGDHFELQRGTTYRSSLLGEPGPILLGLASIGRHGGFRSGKLRTYGGESPDKILVAPSDLYVSLKDVTQSAELLGAVARLPPHLGPGRLTQDTVRLVPKYDLGATADFLYWLLRTPHYRDYCRQQSTGTTTLGLSREAFLEYPVPALTRGRLRVIDALGTLDDKIDSNRRLAATAEAAAACACADVATFARTPPRWTSMAFSAAVEVSPRVRVLKGADTPFVEMAAVAPFATRPHLLARRAFVGGAKFEHGDTLMARITGCIENGKGAFVDFVDEPSAGSTEFVVFRAKPPLSPEAVFALSRDPALRAHAIANMIGTSGRQRVDNACWGAIDIALAPPSAQREDAIRLMAHCMRIGRGLWAEARTLTTIRGALLPKLISGQIRVPVSDDSAEALGAAVEALDDAVPGC